MGKIERIECEGKHAWLLSFAFLCGALFTLVYLPPGVMSPVLYGDRLLTLVSAVFVLMIQLSLSACGQAFIPAVFAAFGVLMALNANSAYLEFFSQREVFFRRLGITALLMPLGFWLGVWGMTNSGLISAAMKINDSFTKGRYIAMYTLMMISMAAAGLSAMGIILK